MTIPHAAFEEHATLVQELPDRRSFARQGIYGAGRIAASKAAAQRYRTPMLLEQVAEGFFGEVLQLLPGLKAELMSACQVSGSNSMRRRTACCFMARQSYPALRRKLRSSMVLQPCLSPCGLAPGLRGGLGLLGWSCFGAFTLAGLALDAAPERIHEVDDWLAVRRASPSAPASLPAWSGSARIIAVS